MADAPKPTKAQLDVLVWLAREGLLDGDGLRGGTLTNYYAERHRASCIAEFEEQRPGEPVPDYIREPRWTGGSGKMHAWRRTGGRLLGNMHRAGLLVWLRTSWGTPEYRLTNEAKALARAYAAREGGGG